MRPRFDRDLVIDSHRAELLLWPKKRLKRIAGAAPVTNPATQMVHMEGQWHQVSEKSNQNERSGSFRVELSHMQEFSIEGQSKWAPLSGWTAVWNTHYHIISIFHRGNDFSNHTAISRGREENLNQPADRGTYGWLIRPAFTCWLISTSWIKMPLSQQERDGIQSC